MKTGALLLLVLAALPGCSRMFWRSQADFDTYNNLLQKTQDPRWDLPRITVEPDPRSRFYDPFDPDVAPLPPDDPAAHRYMHWVDGMRGYKNWHKFGDTPSIDSPLWQDQIPQRPEVAQANWESPYKPLPEAVAEGTAVNVRNVPTIEDLTLEQAIELSAIHNRELQFAIEGVYLSSLALTFDQFQFQVRYLGLGRGRPTSTLGYFTTPSGQDTWEWNNRFGVSQLLPTGGQWVAELANNTLWLLQGQNESSSTSVLTFQLTQPLLLGAGRKIVLENLTQAERDVLYDVRLLARFRKIFFSNVVVGGSLEGGQSGGFLGLLRLQQQVLNQRNNIRQLLVQVERSRGQNAIPPQEFLEALPAPIPEIFADRLSFNRVLKRLTWRGPMTVAERDQLLAISPAPDWQSAIGNLYSRAQAGVVPLEVAQLLTRLSQQIQQLRDLERQYLDAVDQYKLTLGLPPDLQLTINNRLLKQFELIDPRINAVEQELSEFKLELEPIDETDPSREAMLAAWQRLDAIRRAVQENGLNVVAVDFARVAQSLPQRLEKLRDPRDREVIQQDIERNKLVFRGVIQDMFEAITRDLEDLGGKLAPDAPRPDRDAEFRQLDRNGDGWLMLNELASRTQERPLEWDANQDGRINLEEYRVGADRGERQRLFTRIDDTREDLLQIAQNLKSVQAGLRSELISIAEFDLSQEQAVALAIENRLDLMNLRGRVMDARRQMEVAANRLEAVLNLVARSDVRTSSNSRPFDFRADRSTFQAGVQFTAPIDQVAERNNYRAAQIAYQRARRAYMELEDEIKLQVRSQWRLLQTSSANFETTRQNLRIAAIQLDSAIETFNQPAQASQVGQRTGGGGGQSQNQGLNLINALQSVLQAQNDLIRIWVQYEQNRINIYRDMDIMQIDERGLWVDPVYQNLPPVDSSPPSSDEPADETLRPAFQRDLVDRFAQRLFLDSWDFVPSAAAPLGALASADDGAGDLPGHPGSELPDPRSVVPARATVDRNLDDFMEAARPQAGWVGDGTRAPRSVPDHGGGAWHARQHEKRRADE